MPRYTYNSQQRWWEMTLMAPYYNAIEPTTIDFEIEGVSAFVDSLGHIEFFDSEGNSLGFVDVPAAEDPSMYAHSGQYGRVNCLADGKTIRFELPVYHWIDSYPHCDGEYDRWTRRVSRWFTVTFDCKTHQIRVEGKERHQSACG